MVGEVFSTVSIDGNKEQNHLRLCLEAMLKAEENKKREIAHKLRDDVAQSVLTLAQRLDLMTSAHHTRLLRPVKENLDDIRSLAIQAYTNVYSCAEELSPSVLEDLVLVAALEWLCDELKKEQGINASVRTFNVSKTVPPSLKSVLFRVAQEALSNVKVHAHATEATIELEISGAQVRMTVSDNGRGFKVPTELGLLVRTGKLGLANIEGWVQSTGGTLTIQSAAGKGAKLIIELPFESP